MTSKSLTKGQDGLWPIIDSNKNLVYFVPLSLVDQFLEKFGPPNYEVDLNSTMVSFWLHTDRVIPQEHRPTISMYGLQFGLTKLQIARMTATKFERIDLTESQILTSIGFSATVLLVLDDKPDWVEATTSFPDKYLKGIPSVVENEVQRKLFRLIALGYRFAVREMSTHLPYDHQTPDQLVRDLWKLAEEFYVGQGKRITDHAKITVIAAYAPPQEVKPFSLLPK